MSDILGGLSDVQREAVVCYDGPSLIIAGAGSGKTRVLTSRIAYMLEEGISPHSVLALTFTNKAAREMRDRIGRMVSSERARGLWMGTFHSVFARILRAESAYLGYPQSFTIYDAADARNVVKMIVREMELNEETYAPNDIMARISLAKNNLVTPQAYEGNSAYITEDRERRRPQFAEVYRRYAARCRDNGAMDFDDLLLNTNILFKDFPDVLEKYRRQFRYILVDEYQDTNYAQYIIIRRLASGDANICVVGDDAQSIYSFRGAKIENILNFRNDFPQARIFKLERNYRSTRNIVDAANSVIEKNSRRLNKRSFSEGDAGELVRVVKSYTDKEEAAVIAADIRNRVRDSGASYGDMAVLYRTNAQSRVLEESLRTRGIPYRIYGGMSFYQRKEIKNLLGYVRLVVNPKDDEAFLRIINTPARGIGDVTVGKISDAARERGISMWEAVSTLDMNDMDLNGGTGKKLRDFTAMINELSAMRGMADAYELGLAIATRSGIIGSFKAQNTPEAMSALENIDELLNSIRSFGEEQQRMSDEQGENITVTATIEEWLQNIALLTDVDKDDGEDGDRITLMTIHSAKGLEFEYVYIAGLEENLFPSLMSMGAPEGVEEERRLFYVALTRAKKAAMLTFAQSRFKWGSMTFSQPSRFLSELDKTCLDINCTLDDHADPPRPVSPERGQYGEKYGGEKTRYGEKKQHDGGGRYGAGAGSGEKGQYGDRQYGGNNVYRQRVADYVKSQNPNRRPDDIRDMPVGNFKKISKTYAQEGSGTLPPNPFPSAQHQPHTSPHQPAADFTGDYAIGMQVEHSKFGVGTIVALEEFANDVKITVDFNGVGQKTLLKRFAKLMVRGRSGD